MGFWIVSSETFISDQQGDSQRTVIVFSFLHSIGIVTIGMWNPSALLIHCTYASMRRSRCNNKSLWTMFVCVSYKCSSVFCCLCVFFSATVNSCSPLNIHRVFLLRFNTAYLNRLGPEFLLLTVIEQQEKCRQWKKGGT